MAYRIEITRRAVKELRALGTAVRQRIHRAVSALGDDPRPPGCLELSGSEHTWRIRVGDYRVLYEIHDDRLVIVLVRVAHRRQSYR